MKQIKQIFIPGSKWLYIKLYTGYKTADKLLVNDVSFIIKQLQKKDIIEKWFFIRYGDPEFHLRIRLLIKDEIYLGEVINLFFKRLENLVKDNLIWKIQIDTYSRELKRYGNELIEEAESIFFIDSECILSIIEKIDRYKNENYRWMAALKLIDYFFNDFSLDLSVRQKLMNEISLSFKTEFGFNQYNSKQFNGKFRENKKIIEDVLNNIISDTNFLKLYRPMQKRSKQLLPHIIYLNEKIENSKESISINSLLTSYIHMMVNRLFRSQNRQHELILYDFMYRYYSSELARRKYNK